MPTPPPDLADTFHTVDVYSTHRPMLWRAAQHFDFAPVITEYGAGRGSTPLLCKLGGQSFSTYETNHGWASEVDSVHVRSYRDLIPEIRLAAAHEDIVFIDCAPAEMRAELIRVYARQPSFKGVIIAHDSNLADLYGYTDAFKSFAYQTTDKRLYPWTTALSNHVDVTQWKLEQPIVFTPLVLAIASVPWRAGGLGNLLNSIAASTVLPARIHLILDGYADADAAFIVGDARNVTFVNNPAPKGPGERWRFFAELAKDPSEVTTIGCVIDDDFTIGPNYLAQTVSALQLAFDEAHGIIAWSGCRASDGEYIPWHLPDVPKPVPLLSAGAGTSAFFVQDLAGVLETPMVEKLFAPGGDDEAAVSYHLWKKGVHLVRPPSPGGKAPEIFSNDALQSDPRASWMQHGYARLRDRLELRDKHGWHVYKMQAQFRDVAVHGVPVTRRPRLR